MFKNKFILFIIFILILCLILLSCHVILNNNSELDSDIYENSNDTVLIQMLDDNGNVKLVPVTETYAEGQASS